MTCCEGMFGRAPDAITDAAKKSFIVRNEIEKICDEVAETGKMSRQQLVDLFALERIEKGTFSYGPFPLPEEFNPLLSISITNIVAKVKGERFEFSENELNERRKELGLKLGIYSLE